MEPEIIRCVSDGRRIDVQLSQVSGLTRSRISSLMESGCCSVDDSPCLKAGTKPCAGKTICLEIPAPKPAVPQAEDIPLDILYEDDDLAVVIKPCGMVVHPAPGHEEGTLVNALLSSLSSLGGIGGELRPGIVHRLDKDTSGLLLVAKNDETQLALSRMLSERKIEKHYRAMIEGIPGEYSGTINLPVGRSKKDRKKMAVVSDGREAITEWSLLASGRNCALLDVHILTGRTHQIRVHMKAIGHPVCGDPIYGIGKGVRVPRLMLHAYSLAFSHPRTGIPLSFTAELPAGFVEGLVRNGIPIQ